MTAVDSTSRDARMCPKEIIEITVTTRITKTTTAEDKSRTINTRTTVTQIKTPRPSSSKSSINFKIKLD